MTPPERESGDDYEYKPDFEENPSHEVPPQPPAIYDPDDDDPDDLDHDEDLREGPNGGYGGGPYNSDEDEGGGTMKRLQIGCGVFILFGLVMAIVVPVFGSFGGDDGNSGVATSASGTQGAQACDMFLDFINASPEGIAIDESFADSVGDIAEAAEDAEPSIRDSSAGLSASADALMAAATDAEVTALQQEIDVQGSNLIQACINEGYFIPGN